MFADNANMGDNVSDADLMKELEELERVDPGSVGQSPQLNMMGAKPNATGVQEQHANKQDIDLQELERRLMDLDKFEPVPLDAKDQINTESRHLVQM